MIASRARADGRPSNLHRSACDSDRSARPDTCHTVCLCFSYDVIFPAEHLDVKLCGTWIKEPDFKILGIESFVFQESVG